MKILLIICTLPLWKCTMGELDVKITEMLISTTIIHRYAVTTIRTKMKNFSNGTKEAKFSELFPEDAYISAFSMKIAGKNYSSYITDSKEASKYKTANENSDLKADNSYRFTVAVDIDPGIEVEFLWRYDQLLKRIFFYEYVVNIHPKQVVKNLKFDLKIEEKTRLEFVKILKLRSNKEGDPNCDLDPRDKTAKPNENTYGMVFNPTEEKQKELAYFFGMPEDEGFNGQIIIQYEVERNYTGGEIVVKDGHFIHFFGPKKAYDPKHMIFVLDTSGSMFGDRIKNLIVAMKQILSELTVDEDYFSILVFSSNVYIMDVKHPDSVSSHPSATIASKENIKIAKKLIERLGAAGGTSALTALTMAVTVREETSPKLEPIILFLTDGGPVDATPEEILSVIKSNCPLHTLGLGEDVNEDFLKGLAKKNNGFFKKISDSGDASKQMVDFYKQIRALLINVEFNYNNDAYSLTDTFFKFYFRGEEKVAVGTASNFTKVPVVTSEANDKSLHFEPRKEDGIKGVEKIWAFMTIKESLKSGKNNRAYNVALNASFLTPVTYMMVTKPDGNYTIRIEKVHGVDNKYSPVNCEATAKPPTTTPSSTLSPEEKSSDKKSSICANTRGIRYDTWQHFFINDSLSEHYLFKCLDWLYRIYDKKTETIKFYLGEYKLAYNPLHVLLIRCQNGLGNSTGYCTHLLSCNGIENYILTIGDYLQHFCPINKNYAGVCCSY